MTRARQLLLFATNVALTSMLLAACSSRERAQPFDGDGDGDGDRDGEISASGPDQDAGPDHDSSAGDGRSTDGAPLDGAPWDSAPWDSAPWDSAPWDSAPWDSAPLDGSTTDGGMVCNGIDLTQDGVLTLDLSVVKIRGRVTLNGMPLPDMTVERGKIRFTRLETGSSIDVDLGTSGARTYALALAPGRYSIAFAAAECPLSPEMPCVSGTLVPELLLDRDGVLDVDIPAVPVTGELTVDGHAAPESFDVVGRLRFTSAGAAGSTSELEAFANIGIRYSIVVLPGVYNVTWVPLGLEWSNLRYPRVEAMIVGGVDLHQRGVLDLDLRTVRVRGEVNVAGARLERDGLGRVRFHLAGGGAASSPPLLASGQYETILWPGTYDVSWQSDSRYCEGDQAPAPCNSGRILSGAVLSRDGVLDIDVPRVRINGRARYNGGALPSDTRAVGRLEFATPNASSWISPTLGARGDVYAATLLPGDYDVLWRGEPAQCQGRASVHPPSSPPLPPPLPCNDGTIMRHVPLTRDGVLNVAVEGRQITGRVTLLGAVMPDSNVSRGRLVFSSDGGDLAIDADFAGDFLYGATLLVGTYEAKWRGNAELCSRIQAPEIPCSGGVLRPEVSLSTNGLLDLDLPRVRVRGEVRLSGGELPREDRDRGAVFFASTRPATVESLLTRTFGVTGPGVFTVSLFPGTYRVDHDANEDLCNTFEPTNVPCTDTILLGCP